MPQRTVRERYHGRFFKMDEFMQEQLQVARAARAAEQGLIGALCSCCGADACGSSCCCNCSEASMRCLRLTRFVAAASVSFLFAVAPWVVACAEVAAVVAYYLAEVPDAFGTRRGLAGYSFSYVGRVEDVVAISCARGAAVFAAYCLGTGDNYQRPYFYAAAAFAVFGFPYVGVKACLFHYPPGRGAWLPYLTIMCISLGYTLFHLLTAQRVMTWARRRYFMGLSGFGYPWEEGEQAWIMGRSLRQLDAAAAGDGPGPGLGSDDGSGRGGGTGGRGGGPEHDVQPQDLADHDSKFMELGQAQDGGNGAAAGGDGGGGDPGLCVHYKEWWPSWWLKHAQSEQGLDIKGRGELHATAAPPVGPGAEPGTEPGTHAVPPGAQQISYDTGAGEVDVNIATSNGGSSTRSGGIGGSGGRDEGDGIVLVHGFGGGTFAWREVATRLADEAGCRVVAFDRPGFGLTSRPSVPHSEQHLADNPYSAAAQAHLALQLCTRLGLCRVVFVGHSDGALVALMAAALCCPAAPSTATRRTAAGTAEDASTAGAGGLGFAPTEALAAGSMDAAWMSVPVESYSSRLRAAWRSFGSGSGVQEWGRRSFDRHDDRSYPSGGGLFSSGRDTGASPAAAGTSYSIREPLLGWRPRPVPTALPTAGPAAPTTATAAPYNQQRQEEEEIGGGQEDEGDSVAVAVDQDEEPPTTPADQHATATATATPRSAAPKEQRVFWSGNASTAASGCGRGGAVVQAAGIALLHPCLLGEGRPAFASLLANTRLGRRMLRPLLRSQVGEVAHRAAWYDASRLTPAVLELYKRPLRVVDWDTALVQVCRFRKELSREQLDALQADVASLPALVLTGMHDVACPPHRAHKMAEGLAASRLTVLPECGHLSMEERPGDLLRALAPFAQHAFAEGDAADAGPAQP